MGTGYWPRFVWSPKLNRRSLERRFRTSRLIFAIFAVFCSNLLSIDRARNMHGRSQRSQRDGVRAFGRILFECRFKCRRQPPVANLNMCLNAGNPL
jgi:hypothetical protein